VGFKEGMEVTGLVVGGDMEGLPVGIRNGFTVGINEG